MNGNWIASNCSLSKTDKKLQIANRVKKRSGYLKGKNSLTNNDRKSHMVELERSFHEILVSSIGLKDKSKFD